MIKFDFTSHFVTVLCLMVILVSTLLIIDIFRKFKMGYEVLCNLFKGIQSMCYTTDYTIPSQRCAWDQIS